MRSNIPIIFILTGLLTASCGHNRQATACEAVERCDSLPEGVKNMVRAVADDDAGKFAATVSYPLARPYPLHDIQDARQMESYYHTLVDDSLRRVITTSMPDQWSEYGWRGWALKDGRYVWIDSLVYDIPYVSAREQADLERLRLEELNTLRADLRGDWLPLGAMTADNGDLIRIDAARNATPDSPDALRLLVYRKGTDPHGNPSDIFTGSLSAEGTDVSPIYEFADKGGRKWTYIPYPDDGSEPAIYQDMKDGSERTVNVRHAYWMDIVGKK